MCQEFSQVAEFALVYITEAHACDEWSIHSSRCTYNGQPVEVSQTRTLHSRLAIAQDYMKNYNLENCGMRLLVDNPELHTLETGHRIEGNSFERIFAPWPLRFYLIMNSKINWISEPSGGMFSLEELRAAILRETGVMNISQDTKYC